MKKNVTEQVAREKERASRAMGDSPAKARKYADEVRAYDRKNREKGGR